MLDQLRVSKHVVGTKQTLKMIKGGRAESVYLAKDVDRHIYNEIESTCKEYSVGIVYVENMEELGKACGINRKTATAAILKD